jgi:hypothetical protein
MPIGNAVERGTLVYVYDEYNRQLFTLSRGVGAEDGLKGYTASRVNIRRGSLIYSYDDRGIQRGTISVR